MQVIYNKNLDRFIFNDLSFDEVTIIEHALINHAMEMEGKPRQAHSAGSVQAELNTLIDYIDYS